MLYGWDLDVVVQKKKVRIRYFAEDLVQQVAFAVDVVNATAVNVFVIQYKRTRTLD